MPNDDYIKRSDANKALIEWCKDTADRRSWSEVIKDVPAADVEPKSKWIPVTERLPEYPGRFMCFYEVEESGEVGHCIDWGRYDPDDGWYVSGVTHWMPLPEPPKEEDDG